MYRCETVDVLGSPMPVLLFEPAGEGPHPGLVIAQHLPVAHAGLEHDPFQIKTGERYSSKPPFHPPAIYPEYPYDSSELDESNMVYEGVRNLLRLLE